MKDFCEILVGGLVAILGLVQPAHAYTLTQTETGKQVRWAVDTVAFRAAPSFKAMLDKGQPEQALSMAVEAWRGYAGVPDLVIAEGEPGPPGHDGHRTGNSVHYLRLWPYPSEQLAVTVATYEVQTGRMLDTDILVNGEASFQLCEDESSCDKQDYDLAAVLTHECGHVLGLGESHDDREATMWPYASIADTHQRTLAQDDEDGAITAYEGAPPEAAAGCGTASIGGSHTRTRRAISLWLGAGLLLIAFRRSTLRIALGAGVMSLVLAGVMSNPQPARLEQSKFREAPADKLQVRDQWTWGREGDASQHGSSAVDQEPQLSAKSASEPDSRVHHHEQVFAVAQGRDMGAAGVVPMLDRILRDKPWRRVGRARKLEVREEDGLLSTRYEVRTSDGELVEVWLPGGIQGEIAQRIGHSDLPEDGSELFVAQDARGRTAWTYHHEGTLYGGALGAEIVDYQAAIP